MLTIPVGWQVEGNFLVRKFEFKTYTKALAFLNAVAWAANQMNHHPDMTLSFGHCLIKTTTHDAGHTITEKDVELAKVINQLYGQKPS